MLQPHVCPYALKFQRMSSWCSFVIIFHEENFIPLRGKYTYNKGLVLTLIIFSLLLKHFSLLHIVISSVNSLFIIWKMKIKILELALNHSVFNSYQIRIESLMSSIMYYVIRWYDKIKFFILVQLGNVNWI